jgi:localization factor PodJL
MSAGAPWSVKGIDPKAREVAKDLARRSGMTLGEWLNQIILEDGPDEVTSESFFPERSTRTDFEAPQASMAPPAAGQSSAHASGQGGFGRYEAPIHPGDEIGRVTRALDRLTDRIESSETRTGLAISGVEYSVREAVARIEAAEREHIAVAARFEGAVGEGKSEQVRIAERLRRIEQEAAGPRSAEALRALEQALGKVANHLYEGEGRTRETLAEVQARMGRIENRGEPDSAGLIEAVVSRVGERLGEAEARTAQALEGLRDSFAALDGRLVSVESGAAPALEQRLEQLATELTHGVETARAEIAQQLQASATGRFDRMERKLAEMDEHVRVAERTSAQAIDRMGREVLTMADSLNRRVQTAEERGVEGIEHVGGEVARLAQVVETKLGRTESIHAEALEKLGGEIARITERLAERIASSERRSAQAIDDVGEQVVRVAEKVNQRQERTSEDLVERIRQSEERTARLLDEAREKIDKRLEETQRQLAEQASAAPTGWPAEDASAFPGFEREAPLRGPLARQGLAEAFPAPQAFPSAEAFPGAEAFSEPEPFAAEPAPPPLPAAEVFSALARKLQPEPAFEAAPEEIEAEEIEAEYEPFASPAPEPEPFSGAAPPPPVFGEAEPVAAQETQEVEALARTFAAEPARPAFDAADFEAADGFAPLDEPALDRDYNADDDDFFAAPHDEPAVRPEPAVGQRPLTTREVIEQARASVRASAQANDPRKARKPAVTAGPVPPKDSGSILSRIPFLGSMGGRSKRRGGSSLQTALLVAGGAAFLGVAASGIALMASQPGGAPSPRLAHGMALGRADGPVANAEPDTAPELANPRAAVALSPQPLSQAEPVVPAALPPGQDMAGLYAQAAQAVETREPGGLDSLKKVANLGYAPAQFYLAKLYEAGSGGLRKDLVEARRWTERAAQGGDAKAMHNLAIANFYGTGGAKNADAAAQWFRRAADLGLVDSQYNLGRLYEEGLGVSQNSAEAYKWYLIAARGGDAESRTSAQRVRAGLTPDARAVAERGAVGFRAMAPNAPASAMADNDATSLVTAQRALSRLGYYQGPVDGSASPALKLAVAAYQREQGVAATGVLDQTTMARLAVFIR